MIDLLTLKLIAGNGGRGKISFRREKHVPKGGPDGGDGGDGGSIIIRASSAISTLRQYAGVKEIAAKDGQVGGKRKRHGQQAEDIVVEVPVGTSLTLLAENQTSAYRRQRYGFLNEDGSQRLLRSADLQLGQAPTSNIARQRYFIDYDVVDGNLNLKPDEIQELPKAEEICQLMEPGQELILCQGGFGGRGNTHFKSSKKTTPREAEHGTFGERKLVKLELKLLADLALVGFPNAGKSTFLSKVTAANPKIANYPFTTLEPNLGIMRMEQSAVEEIVIADIPGLIEGASQGKGLGHDFLRHIENCQALMYLLFLEESTIFDRSLSIENKSQLLWQQYQSLNSELKQHDAGLLKKSNIVTLNKADLYSPEEIKFFEATFKKQKIKLLTFSAITGDGLQAVIKAVENLFN